MFTLLNGVRVLEVSLLAPDTAGQHLADLGADVLKVEPPGRGDYVRQVGTTFLDGISLMHRRWNRGKQSIVLDLKADKERELFLTLARRCDVMIDGLRSGALEDLGLGYEELSRSHPTLVYCSLSGLGTSGPYRRLATHGLFYDAYAGLAPPDYSSVVSRK
jgi:crotonobetainyl-CoA:carnitine CoA-transferase CaiB-like acyl-CoA transferase